MDMEHNKYEEVLVKYLLNETNAVEEQFIKEWLGASENNRLHLLELANTLKLVKATDDIQKINIEEEWQYFQQLRDRTIQPLIPDDNKVTRKSELFPVYEPAGRSKVYKLLLVGAVAASLILAVLFGPGTFSGNKTGNSETAKNESIPNNSADPLTEVILHEMNTTGKVKTISLPDGTVVNLYPQSEFTYRQPGEGRTREVTLLGNASFKVAKNKTKPFMVFSGEIYTTALGTEFLVKAMPKAKQIFVRLFEGSVVVRSDKNKKGKKINETFLVPGQELVYDIASGNASVRSFLTETDTTVNQTDNPLVINDNKKPWFMFNNQALPSVLDDLSKMYGVEIVYTREEIRKMYFIGKFDKSDSVEFILKQIATINNLTITKENNTYTVRKQAPQPKN